MALTSPALTVANEILFDNVKPVLDCIKRIGVTDFGAGAPEYAVKPGKTVKVPMSVVSKASEYNDSTNNYLTGGDTNWASLTAKHYLQGFDISGVNVDQGVDAAKMKQLFTSRASTGIAMAVQDVLATALDTVQTSTGVTIPAAGTASISDYMELAASVTWLDRSQAVIAMKGSELAALKAKFAAERNWGTPTEIAREMGFKDIVLVPGMSDRMCIVPFGTMGFLGRVPAIIARYQEAGVEIDPDSGLAVGIVIADDQAKNRQVANADLWFGATTIDAPAAATSAGIINVGTAV